jgi:hypothetical protein
LLPQAETSEWDVYIPERTCLYLYVIVVTITGINYEYSILLPQAETVTITAPIVPATLVYYNTAISLNMQCT